LTEIFSHATTDKQTLFDIIYSFQPFFFAIGLMTVAASLELFDASVHRMTVSEGK
tara:strand:+ start:252 stop:416 length:165 start_codon:yes stop_codon:yes gene_type:complete